MEAFIYDAVRTPRGKGKKDGSLFGTTPLELAATALRAIRDRNRLDTALVDDVVLGCVIKGETGHEATHPFTPCARSCDSHRATRPAR